ncbi:MAG TPA: orotate phosphoribosyltransferase [Bacillota bacterium]|nr:orotate phosphoribosyltransferase [Bacillota bacterium]HOL09653.1 orotate phosphoribosyltransferase [Bacillota bacterium]HPO97506.1 orotate phosphoribosyltransferase [Bacillota bacterium]
MLDQKELLEIFRETKVLREGHFKLASGKHTKKQLQCALLVQYPNFNERVCEDLARRFKGVEIDVVVSPAIGGILVGYEVAKCLGVRAVFTERENGKMTLRRGFNIEDDENVLVISDVLITGSAINEVIEVIKERGANLCGVGVLVDRSNGKISFGTRKEALYTTEFETWDPEECPICGAGIPFTKNGTHR